MPPAVGAPRDPGRRASSSPRVPHPVPGELGARGLTTKAALWHSCPSDTSTQSRCLRGDSVRSHRLRARSHTCPEVPVTGQAIACARTHGPSLDSVSLQSGSRNSAKTLLRDSWLVLAAREQAHGHIPTRPPAGLGRSRTQLSISAQVATKPRIGLTTQCGVGLQSRLGGSPEVTPRQTPLSVASPGTHGALSALSQKQGQRPDTRSFPHVPAPQPRRICGRHGPR